MQIVASAGSSRSCCSLWDQLPNLKDAQDPCSLLSKEERISSLAGWLHNEKSFQKVFPILGHKVNEVLCRSELSAFNSLYKEFSRPGNMIHQE